tara:strand:+ start:57 stop:599 length:543 start_codon:yes stop_codon:yes gene_type:complete
MAAEDRKIIFGGHVVVKESASSEESIDDKWILYPGIEKPVGGKGIVTNLHDDQWSDSWCSMSHDQKHWEDYADTDDHSGNRWEDSYNSWNNQKWIGTGANQLTQTLAGGVDVDVAFLYIKNLGTQEAHVSLDGSSGEYDLLVPAGASLALRGVDAAFHCDDVYVKTASGETYIDYVLAKE